MWKPRRSALARALRLRLRCSSVPGTRVCEERTVALQAKKDAFKQLEQKIAALQPELETTRKELVELKLAKEQVGVIPKT
eukprot:1178302-Prorocentrum_minimum.AAC.4